MSTKLSEMSPAFQAQTAEFDAVNELIRCYQNLPAIVDDDYPEQRHHYERAAQALLNAFIGNGRMFKP